MTQILKFKKENVFCVGRSIGTGPATYLASQNPIGSLCLITPFTSIKDTVKDIYGSIAASLVKDCFANKKWIEKVLCPVLFVHGNEDSIVPVQHSRELYSKFITLKHRSVSKSM